MSANENGEELDSGPHWVSVTMGKILSKVPGIRREAFAAGKWQCESILDTKNERVITVLVSGWKANQPPNPRHLSGFNPVNQQMIPRN